MLPVKDVEFWFPCSRLTLTNAAERGLKAAARELNADYTWHEVYYYNKREQIYPVCHLLIKILLTGKAVAFDPFVRILSAELAKNSLLKTILQTLQTQKWHRFPMINVLLFELGSVVFFFPDVRQKYPCSYSQIIEYMYA